MNSQISQIKVCAVFVCLMIVGCARMPVLVPDPSLQIEDATAGQQVKGVHVAASGRAWEGKEQVREHVTPFRVNITNRSGAPLKISYNLFSLTSGTGELYSALPPYSVEGTIYEPAMRSRFACPGFYVAPHYHRFYPYMHLYRYPFYYDPFYFDHYYTCWREISLPTREMLDNAIPEGVLKDGAEASGFLYFQKIGDAPQYVFQMELVQAEGERFGEIRIPFIKKNE
ncbi:MAG: hypothetical protein R6U50_05705 [Desulfobacterales bacterium]